MNTALLPLTEKELDILVSIAIRRAELLDDIHSPAAGEAWREVMEYEERLAAITRSAEITGGVARVGAVQAALAAGRRPEAERLAKQYLAEDPLPAETRKGIARALKEEQKRWRVRIGIL